MTRMGAETTVVPCAVSWMEVSSEPKKAKHQFHRRRALTKDEFKSLLEHTSNTDAKSLFKIYALTGLRRNELLMVKKEDIRKVGEQWRMRVLGKGNKIRDVVLHPIIQGMVTATAESTKRGAIVFPFKPRWVDYWFRVSADKVGFGRDVTLHSLRHSTASWSIRDHADIALVKAMLGHSDIRTTSIYVEEMERFEDPPELRIKL